MGRRLRINNMYSEINTGKITPEIAKILAKIDKVCFTTEAWTAKKWINNTNENTQTIIIYGIRDNIKAALVWGSTSTARVGYLYSFAVLPEFRKRGIGKHIIECFIQQNRIHGNKTMFTHTRVSDTISQHLLNEFKFEPNSYITNYYGNEDGIELKLEL